MKLRLKEIKSRLLEWKDFYGQDIVQRDEIKKAKTEEELEEILDTHYRFLENQGQDAKADLDSFKNELLGG